MLEEGVQARGEELRPRRLGLLGGQGNLLYGVNAAVEAVAHLRGTATRTSERGMQRLIEEMACAECQKN